MIKIMVEKTGVSLLSDLCFAICALIYMVLPVGMIGRLPVHREPEVSTFSRVEHPKRDEGRARLEK